jgi:putative acetyltransferase
MKIRTETPQDINEIEQITVAAFDCKPYSDQTEHLIINRLRKAGAMSLSLVAVMDDKVVGHVAFSVVIINGAKGCVLEGDPGYYQRFGFKSYPGLYYEGSPAPEYFMALPFYNGMPEGKVEFHRAFYMNTQQI